MLKPRETSHGEGTRCEEASVSLDHIVRKVKNTTVVVDELCRGGVDIEQLLDEALAAPQGALGIAEAPFAELQRDDVLVAGCALEPVDGVACVRVLRGAEFVEVRLRT
jgi:hypothetical protein